MLRVTIVFFASVWYITLTTYNGARGIGPQQIAVARSFSASPLQIFWKVILPALYPYLLTGARIGIVHAIRAMVLAEMFVIIGYGGLMHRSGLSLDTGQLLGLLITLMLVSLLFNWLLGARGRWLAPWYDQQRITDEHRDAKACRADRLEAAAKLEARNITKFYQRDGSKLPVLEDFPSRSPSSSSWCCSGHPAAASRHCCASSTASSRAMPDRSFSTART